MAVIAELNSKVMFGLTDLPSEYVQLPEIHRAVVQRYNIRLNQARMSDGNVLLSLSSTFSPPENEPYDVTNIIGQGNPSFVEVFEYDRWKPWPVVNITNLSAARDAWDKYVSFYGDETNGLRQYIQFSVAPEGLCRIRFDKDTTPDRVANTVLLPTHVQDLIVLEAQNTVIPRIKARIALNMARKQQRAADVAPLMGALDQIVMQNMVDIRDLIPLCEIWMYRDRAAQNDINTRKRIPRGRNLYTGNW